MLGLADIPLIPILALLAIIPLVGWQIYNYWQYRRQHQKPNIPDINQKKTVNMPHNQFKNATPLTFLKPKTKKGHHSSIMFTTAIGLFLLVNVVVFSYYLRGQRFTYLPRADEPVTPTVISNLLTPTISPLVSATPALLALTSPGITTVVTPSMFPTHGVTPLLTATRTPSPTPTAMPSITKTPTIAPSATTTLAPTVLALAKTTPTSTPIVITTNKPTDTAVIPQTGIGNASFILAALSLTFLLVGFLI